MRPHLFRTHDGGKTWTEINNGIPDGAATNTVREDPIQKGLLYAGTETQVYVSFDDGDHWQSLHLNLPATSVRDLTIKRRPHRRHPRPRLPDPRRHHAPAPVAANQPSSPPTTPSSSSPQTTIRVAQRHDPPTPWPPDKPTGENPPDGAIIDYYLGPNITGPVTLEILDAKGDVFSEVKSTDPVPPLDPRYPDPTLWFARRASSRPHPACIASSGICSTRGPRMSTDPDDEQHPA